MRTDILRWGGYAAVALALLFAATLALGFAMGVDIYADDEADELLADVDDNAAAFLVWALTSMTAHLLLLPAVLGLFYTAREQDRPWFALVAALFGLSCVLGIIAFGMAPILWDISTTFVDADDGAARTALMHDGENVQSLYLMMGSASMTVFALGMIGEALIARRSGFFPAWVVWPALVIGVVGVVPFFGFIAIVPGRIAWLLVSGVIMINRGREESAPRAVRQRSTAAV